MEVERKPSKGGFFQLFDWNRKSRKKLFANVEGSKQVEENVKSVQGQHHFQEAEDGLCSSYRCSSDYTYASSVASDEGYGSRAPGVVARLMGLDSLPTSNVSEPSSTPFSDYHSLRSSPHETCSSGFGCEYPMEYINFTSNLEESRLHKVLNRPIERTEASPKAASTGKISSIGSSSLPLEIRDLKENSRNKGKSVSIGSQSKLNVRGKEGSTSTNNRSLMNQKEHNELKSNPNPILKSQSSLQQSTQKRTIIKPKNVLRQNNLKQNCASNKDTLAPRKSVARNGAIGPNRTVSKVFINSETGSINMESLPNAIEKKPSSSEAKSFSRKESGKSDDRVQDGFADRELMSIDKSSSALGGCKNWDADSNQKGMDVVSFTFTSPLKRSMHELPSSGPVMEKNNDSHIDSFDDSDESYSNHSTFPSPRFNLDVIGSDELSLLLDQKLRELTHRVECSTTNVISLTSSEHEKKVQAGLRADQPDSFHGCDSPSIDDSAVCVDKKWQELEECSTSSNYSESREELDCPWPNFNPKFKSSFASGNNKEKRKPDNWELEYLKNILNTELRLNEFLLGETDNVIAPNLFDQLENQENEMGKNEEEHSKLRRKVFFDCVVECLGLRCKSVSIGNFKSWVMFGLLVSTRGRLVGQLYEEVRGLRNMGEVVVDEVVDKDMSTLHRRWLEFDIEVYEESVKIEKAILSSLVIELVLDFMF